MSEIQQFYKDSSILITGGTGFLGKLIVEKILRCCQNINKIYLIIRNKNGLNAFQRMDDYFENEVFRRLKVEYPLYKSKVIIIQGDINQRKLNLNPEDEELLINNVNIIFHAAAVITFNQSLRKAVETNLNGVESILELANNMKHLKSFVHISTVFSNCFLKKIDEKIHRCETTHQNITTLLNTCTDDEIEQLIPSLMANTANTYTFTKALAENFISENYGSLPVGIFRPAIVISTAKEPFSGWIDNYYGPTGLIISAACGLLHVVLGGNDVFSNIVPGDMVVNGIIASGWEISLQRKKLPIYNYVSIQAPVTWGEFVDLTKIGLNYPFSNSVWYISLFFTKHKWLYSFCSFCLHLIPAYIFDTILKVFKKKPYLVRTYKKIHSVVNVISYFSLRHWEYENKNVLELWDRMSEKDKILFNFDMSSINWKEYFKHYIKGIRLYLYKDDLSNLEKARTNYRRLFWAHQICKYFFIMLLFYYFLLKL